MHEIDRLSESVRASVRDKVYQALADYALGGNHGPIPVKRLFLMAADELVRAGIIDRPDFLGGQTLGGQKFVELVHGRQPETVFPDYGIPRSIANLMRQTFWELYIQGVLAPAPKVNPLEETGAPPKHEDYWLCLDSVMLTPYGVRVLRDSGDRIRVHDPDGYLANFQSARPSPDPEMMQYVTECVQVFRSGHLLAAVVLLGIASERLVEVLAQRLRDTLGPDNGVPWYNNTYRRKQVVSDRFDVLVHKLMSEYGPDLASAGPKDGFENIVPLTFHMIRDARNSIAHPSGRCFTWNEVSGYLHCFVPYFLNMNRVMGFLAANPR